MVFEGFSHREVGMFAACGQEQNFSSNRRERRRADDDSALARLGSATPYRADLRKNLERVMGIEPTLFAWEAEVLPLNYTRMPVTA